MSSNPPRGASNARGRQSQNNRGKSRGGNFRGRGNWGGRSRWRGGFARNNSSPPTSSRPDHGASQPVITSLFQVVPGPYRGWKLYFHQEGYSEGSLTVKKVQAAEAFLQQYRRQYPLSDIHERRSFSLNLKNITIDENFNSSWPSFLSDLNEEPEHTINCLGLAIHHIVQKELDKEAENEQVPPVQLPAIRIRVVNHEPVLQLKHLKANYFEKLVSVRGTVIRVGNLKLVCVWLAFTCNACQAVQCVRQPQGIYTQPTKCSADMCRCRSFTPAHSSPFTQTANWQTVRLQEIVADEQREGGRVPRSVECELMEDLVDSCVPGDIVTITGVIRVHNTEESASKRKTASMFLLYIEAVSIVNNKNNSAGGRTSSVGVEFSLKDYYAIQEIHSETALFRLLVNSLCPAIYGHEVVKAGLFLGLMGGGNKPGRDVRSDIHILVVGDPGLGKSQMLQASSNVAPRGVYVCGNTSTAAGLTVTLSREGGGDYALEAGALVLADQGCCCIDEFDKMSNQHQALLEAMEQQSISIAKAGVVCSLPARTSILAAANPVSGHYNRSKTVSENLRMGQPLLSRFDLVFILMDQPNEHLDSLLSEHVMALHSGARSRSSVTSSQSHKNDKSLNDDEVPLSERLKLYPNELFDPIPHQLLRKYIAYARKYVNPVLSAEASDIIQKFYLELRNKHHTADSTPVTTRQLESLIRLTEARAKLELREEATEKDALDVIEIMRCSLVDSFADELGVLDFGRSQNGSGMSKQNKAKKFIAVMQRRAEQQSKSIFSVSEMREIAQACGVPFMDFFDFLTSLNNQGYLLKKGKDQYRLLSVY